MNDPLMAITNLTTSPEHQPNNSHANLNWATNLRWEKSIRSHVEKLIKKQKSDELAELLAFHGCRGKGSVIKAERISFLQSLKNLLTIHGNEQHRCFPVLEILLSKPEDIIKSNQQLSLSELIEDLLVIPVTSWLDLKIADTVVEAGLFLCCSRELSSEQCLAFYQRLVAYHTLIEQTDGMIESDRLSSLDSLLLKAESRYLLGIALEHLAGTRSLRRNGLSSYAEELDALTDNDGTPHATLLSELPLWMASFQRGNLAGQWAEKNWLNRKTQDRWQDLLQRTASLTSSQGQLALANGTAQFWPGTLADSLLKLNEKKRPNWMRQTLQSIGSTSTTSSKSKRSKANEDLTAATQSDWGKLASLRCNWYPGSDHLTIAYGSSIPQIEFSTLGLPLLNGLWNTELKIEGQICELQSEWNSLCWYNDEAGDYIELRNETEHAIIDRQIFLSRNDQVALLSDSVTTKTDATVQISWKLPLEKAWKGKQDTQTRSWKLRQQKRDVRLMPLAIPEDIVHRADGKLECTDEAITLEHTGRQNVCMPLWLDWSPTRRGKACDWSQLTITEAREVLPSPVAFAARCRVANSQWLFLRNLEFNGTPRAVMGLNTDAETVIAEVNSLAQAEKLVEVQYEEEE
ncbi:hypothetical protein [Rubinisphaera sp.]|uniref:hypothetical protein n=1 Tax=Rubinisphaera sp. TaxID=2024857 RepID=UPI000C1114D6|nr:hypothetical protein [Rubinisphaera sp.]MBV11743.1 hypothetical protein [Rubinisphaera sp.]|tara:strand:+ start:6996 stop:8888 length:1893 start_codon:yes stop_codon:yes gene_type:complete